MKIIKAPILLSAGKFATSRTWKNIRRKIHKAVRLIDWPYGSGLFTIYPQSGKKSGEGNGVGPIRKNFLVDLKNQGWEIEGPAKNALGKKLGDFDAVKTTSEGPVAVEWETGNISSSHRSLNKMVMLQYQGLLAGGFLIVPSTNLAKFLTDRIGNFRELEPYLDFWGRYPCVSAALELVVIEHDATSFEVPRIIKATDGRALR